MNWKFWKKYKVTVYLKSGDRLEFECDEISINKNGNELTGWNIEGVKAGALFYVRLDDVSAITYK